MLPGGLPGAEHLGNHEGLTSHIRCFAENGKYLAAICAAPMVFGAQGVLEGKKATIYPGMEELLKGARPQEERSGCRGWNRHHIQRTGYRDALCIETGGNSEGKRSFFTA